MHRPALLRRLLAVSSVLLAGLSLAACGHKVSNPTSADTEGQYVRAGKVTYQVQLSRQLNPANLEDRNYLQGVKTSPPKPSEQWFAIFVWAKNETHSPQPTTGSFDILDTDGNRYRPVALSSRVNPYAWTSTTLNPLGIEPAPDTTAAHGATQGGELLFKLSNTVYSNRPLTFEIYPPGQSQPSSVSIDL